MLYTEYDYEVWQVSVEGLLFQMKENVRKMTVLLRDVFASAMIGVVERFQHFTDTYK
jgi:hypothetical protein